MPLCEEKTITEARTMDKSELIEKLKKMRLPVIAEHAPSGFPVYFA